MIRGSLENVTEKSVSGWLYADAVTVRDRTVLAFVDSQCIGAGRIEKFRKDLADAGLEDGVLGFQFPIVLPRPTDVPRVTVRFEGSDVVLLQDESRVVSAEQTHTAAPQGCRRSYSSIQWMRAQGWLDQSEYDFLKYTEQLGIYERSLQEPKRVRGTEERAILDPAEAATKLLCLYYMDEVEVTHTTIAAMASLAEVTARSPEFIGYETIVALWSPTRVSLSVAEGSHRPRPEEPASSNVADYHLGPDKLLMLNSRCRIVSSSKASSDGFVVFSVVGQG